MVFVAAEALAGSSLSGIGVEIARIKPSDLYPVAKQIFPGSPASEADSHGNKLEVGERIIAISPTGDEADFEGIGGRSLEDVVNLIRGSEGSRVSLKVIRGVADRDNVDVSAAVNIALTRRRFELSKVDGQPSSDFRQSAPSQMSDNATVNAPSNAQVGAPVPPAQDLAQTASPSLLFTVVVNGGIEGYFRAPDRRDAVYYLNMNARNDLQYVGAIYNTFADFDKRFTNGIPQIRSEAEANSVDGRLHQTELDARCINIFEASLPKFTEWSEQAFKLNPVPFIRPIPTAAKDTNWRANFAWTNTTDGFGMHDPRNELGVYLKLQTTGDGVSLSQVEVSALAGAVKFAPKGLEVLRLILDEAKEKQRSNEKLVEEKFQ